jgi:uncharacterized repeat protein (TIGR01451 family)
MHQRIGRWVGITLIAGLVLLSAAYAQGGFTLSRGIVANGGGTLSGSGFTLTGSIGQPDAGAALSSGNLTLVGGAFAGGSPFAAALNLTKTVDEPNPGPDQRVTYRLIVRNSGSAAAIITLTDVLTTPLVVAGPITIEPAGSGAAGAPPLLLQNRPISAGATLTVTMPVTVPFGLAAGTVLNNTAILIGAAPLITTQSTAALTIRDVAPLARADLTCTNPNSNIRIAVLRNDVDPNGQPLSLIGVSNPDNGTAIIDGPTIIYTPTPGFEGVGTLIYTVSDGTLTASAPVRITVRPGVGSCIQFMPLVVR